MWESMRCRQAAGWGGMGSRRHAGVVWGVDRQRDGADRGWVAGESYPRERCTVLWVLGLGLRNWLCPTAHPRTVASLSCHAAQALTLKYHTSKISSFDDLSVSGMGSSCRATWCHVSRATWHVA